MLILVVNFCFSVKQNSDRVLSINLVPWLLSGREKRLITLQYLPNGNAFYFIRKYCIYFNYRFKDGAKTEMTCVYPFFGGGKNKFSFIFTVAHFGSR